MRIQTLQRIGGILAGLACLMLGGWIIQFNYDSYRRFDLGAQNYMRLTAAFTAANAISSERGPSNVAMGSTAENHEQAIAGLEAKRAATDATLANLSAQFARELDVHEELKAEIEKMSRALETGRAAVDSVVALPEDRRQGLAITRALEAMFRAANASIDLRNSLAQVVIQQAPQISTEIVVATAASDLREFEGRLGSYVVMMLTSSVVEDARHRQNYTHTLVRLSVLRDMLSTYTKAYFNDPEIADLLAQVQSEYFDTALPLVEEITLRHAFDNSLGAADFTSAYVPMMASSEKLREAISQAAQERMIELRDSSMRMVIVGSLLTLFALLVLLGIAWVFSRRLFAPLLALSNQVNVLAAGDLSEPPKQAATSREVAQMFASLDALRRQMREKQSLEQDQQALNEKLRTLAQTDMLTGLPNRRAITDRALDILRNADANNKPVAAIMLDIDHFKRINDNFGHDTGDLVLQSVAKTLRPLLRSHDVFGRYGGEEFMIILPDIGRKEVSIVAERLRQALETMDVGADSTLETTGSFGIAIRPAGSNIDWEALVSDADRQLYRAKRSGRNRVSGPARRDPHAAA